MTTLQADPARIDDAVRQLEQGDIPHRKEIEGFMGFTLLVDRQSGKVLGTSYWGVAAGDGSQRRRREALA